jgi:hypothetical protein
MSTPIKPHVARLLFVGIIVAILITAAKACGQDAYPDWYGEGVCYESESAGKIICPQDRYPDKATSLPGSSKKAKSRTRGHADTAKPATSQEPTFTIDDVRNAPIGSVGPSDSSDKTGHEAWLVVLGAFLLVLYFLPSIVGRKKKNAQAIFVLNLLLGWTLLGWVIALIWANTKD